MPANPFYGLGDELEAEAPAPRRRTHTSTLAFMFPGAHQAARRAEKAAVWYPCSSHTATCATKRRQAILAAAGWLEAATAQEDILTWEGVETPRAAARLAKRRKYGMRWGWDALALR